MPSFVVLNPNSITDKVRAGQQEKLLDNGQAVLRVNAENEDLLKDYIKYSAEEIRQTAIPAIGKIASKHTQVVSQSSLTPIVSIKKQEGNYSTIVTPNFCDSGATYTLRPNQNERLYLVRSEIQLEHDLDFGQDTAVLTYYAWHPAFSEPVIAEQIVCDRVRGLFEIGNAHYTCPPIGTMTNNLTTIKFEQETELVFYGDRKNGNLAYVTVATGSGNALTGTYLTVSFITRLETL